MKNTIINRWFSHTSESLKSSQVKLREGLKILVVDDSRTHLYALEKLLKAEGVKVYTAENGKQGILMAPRVRAVSVISSVSVLQGMPRF